MYIEMESGYVVSIDRLKWDIGTESIEGLLMNSDDTEALDAVRVTIYESPDRFRKLRNHFMNNML